MWINFFFFFSPYKYIRILPHCIIMKHNSDRLKGRRKKHLTNIYTYIYLKDAFDVFHKIWRVFYISYSFNLWKYVKVYMKRPYSNSNSQVSNWHISDVSIIDWLLISHWKAVKESGRSGILHISDVSIIDWLLIWY